MARLAGPRGEHDDHRAAPARGVLTLVVGAVGGVGASTLAALLAAELAVHGAEVGLVDLDATGGGIDVLLGVETASGARWPDLATVHGAVQAGDLDGVLPTWRGVEVLSAGREALAPGREAVVGVVSALLERNADVVLDPPGHALEPVVGAGPVARPDRTLLVTAQDVRGVAGGATVVPLLPGGVVDLVLRRRPDPVVAVEEVGHLLGVPVLTTLGADRDLAGAVDRGLGPVPRRRSRLARAVRRTAHRVSAGG